MDRLMERQLDARAALLLKRAVEAKGIRVLLDVATARFAGNGHVEGVELKDGRVLAADTVVVAVPLTPVSRSIAASSSTIISSPAHPMFSQSVNAPSIAASATVWWSPPTSRRARWPSASPAAMHATIRSADHACAERGARRRCVGYDATTPSEMAVSGHE
jgi:hypothetical protein